jgi:hypothetical protein
MALVALAALISAQSASALSWTNVACAGGAECPKVGTPVAACSCGFYLDSPGSLIADGETVFTFVKSSSEGAIDETAKWKATLVAGNYAGFNEIRARAAANDSSFLKVILYRNVFGNDFNNCLDVSPDIIATLQWGGVAGPDDDDSIFREKSAAVAIAPFEQLGLCIILSDDPDNVAPAVQRSSGQVDTIELRTIPGGARITVESFNRTL